MREERSFSYLVAAAVLVVAAVMVVAAMVAVVVGPIKRERR